MSSWFLIGVLSAWALAHLGLALFFALAYLLGPREREYRVFALLCATLSALTAGIAIELSAPDLGGRYLGDQIAHAAAILAAVLNLDFSLAFAFPRRRLAWVRLAYLSAGLFVVADFFGLLWVRGSYQERLGHAWGLTVELGDGRVSVLGVLFYAAGALATFGSTSALIYAYRSGRRQVLPVLVTAFLVLAAMVNDVGLATGIFRDTLAWLPHVFMLYALGAAGTLLGHYRTAAGELERAARTLQARTEELRHSHAELAQVQNELSTKKQLAAVGELAAAIAHEVRNPLAVIVNAVAGLRRSALRDEDRTMLLDIVQEEAGRLNRLVTDLLRFARPVSVKSSPVSLLELANRCGANVTAGFEVNVHAGDDPSAYTVDVDPNLFRLVLDNLVANACQAMGETGVVDITIEPTQLRGEPAARIEIRDTGHGMEAHVLERALDPFFTTRPSGTGLGLPIVQRIIEAHRGELSLDSSEGNGTRVILTVPRHGEAVSPQAAEAALVASAHS